MRTLTRELPLAAFVLVLVLLAAPAWPYAGPCTSLRDATGDRIVVLEALASPTKPEAKELKQLQKLANQLDAAFALLDQDAGGDDPRSEARGLARLAKSLKLLGKAKSPDPALGPAAQDTVQTQCEDLVTQWTGEATRVVARLDGKQQTRIQKLADKGQKKVVAARAKWANSKPKGAKGFAKAIKVLRKAVEKGKRLVPDTGPVYDGHYAIGSIDSHDDFLPYSEITGNLTIWGSAIQHVELPNLRVVGGELKIYSSTINGSVLESARFPALASVGGFVRMQNVQLTDLAYPELRSAQAVLIENCDQLVDLGAFEALETLTWSIVIKWNDALVDIRGLRGVTGALQAGIVIVGNESLEGLAGLGGIGSLQGGAEITDNDALTTLNGLSITSAGDSVFIDDNDALVDLTGLERLHTVGGTLSVEDCAEIVDLGGLSGLAQVAHITIFRNPKLVSLDGLACPPTLTGNIMLEFLPELTDISALSPLQSLGQTLRFWGCEKLRDLTPLSRLVSLGDDLKLEAMPGLTRLTGLENLRTIDSELVIRQCNVLTDVSALWNLQTSSVSGKVAVIFTWRENGGTTLANELVAKCGGAARFGTLDFAP